MVATVAGTTNQGKRVVIAFDDLRMPVDFELAYAKTCDFSLAPPLFGRTGGPTRHDSHPTGMDATRIDTFVFGDRTAKRVMHVTTDVDWETAISGTADAVETWTQAGRPLGTCRSGPIHYRLG